MKLIIRDSEWGRGEGDGYLRDPETGRMCCLGIHAKAYGVLEEHLNGILMPMTLLKVFGRSANEIHDRYFERWVIDECLQTREAERAMAINDDQNISDEERIERLRPIFAEVGIEIEWRPDE